MKPEEIYRKYANAKRRALYWSGTPSFNPFARSSQTRSGMLDEKYELAMCDCDVWERVIATLTGKRVEHYDPHSAYRHTFSKIMAAVSRANAATQSAQ